MLQKKVSIKKIKVKLDSEAIGYYPCLFPTIVLVIGVFVLISQLGSTPSEGWLVSNYWKILLGTILLEIILNQIIYPNEKIELTIENTNSLSFYYIKNNQNPLPRKIIKFDYWWNYKHLPSYKASYGDESYSGNGDLSLIHI